MECVFLIPIIFLRWMTPHTYKLDRNSHSSLIILLLSCAADLVDFIEYINVEEIVDYFEGVTQIMGKQIL